jgi:putative ABC transport system permease protein
MNDFRLAWHNLLRNRRRSLVTLLIAALGTAAVLVGGGFALYTYDSLREGAAREFGHLTVSHPDFFTRDEETPLQYGITGYDALARRIEADPRVRRVLPRVALSGLVSNGEKSMIFLGTGADIPAEAATRGPFLKLESGRLPEAGAAQDGQPPVMLGVDLARSLAAKPGAGLTLLATTADGAINAIDVVVSGTVSTGWQEIDKRLVYLDVAAAQRLLVTDKVSTLAVFLEATEQTAAVAAALRVQESAQGIKPWWEQAFYYNSVRDLYNRIFGLLGIIIGVLVFFSVSNTLTMAVVERTREIGTLRALGAQPVEVVAGFVREGTLIGLVGTVAGMLLAGAISLTLLFADVQMPPPPGRNDAYPLQVDADLTLYAVAAVAITLLCACAAWFASRKAAAKPIVEALGHV